MIPKDNRFQSDPDGILADSDHLLDGWQVAAPDPSDRFDVARLTQLLRAHEDAGRGWWFWTAVAGFGLGLIGVEYCKVRRNALRARPGAGRRRSRN